MMKEPGSKMSTANFKQRLVQTFDPRRVFSSGSSERGFMSVPALASLAVLAACQSFAQSATPARSFDVASVKVLRSSQGLPDVFSLNPRRSGGRISWTANLTLLLRYAYGLPDWRIVRTDKDQSFYAIDATMDTSATEDQVRLMLQRLLAERFKLASHRETKEVQGYALVVGKNGAKIKASVPGETHPMPEYLAGKSPDAFEGHIFVGMEGKGTSALTGRGVSTAQLAETLSATLGALVLDQTGMKGGYYFAFKFLSVNNSPSDEVEGSTIFSALQDELGLKLEKQKGPVEVLVVDHFEPPSEN
jgi:uncharacterized protein (TIGR03435 family)